MAKKSYEFSFKKKAVQLAITNGNRQAARLLKVDEKRIRDWKLQSANGHFTKLESDIGLIQADKRKKLQGGGRKPNYDEMEDILALWIIEQRQNYFRVTRKSISMKASELVNNSNFKASRGWLDNFLRRHDFVIRAKTTTGQRLPEELSLKVSNFINFCQFHRNRLKISPCHIGNMDETSIWLDMPGQTSVDKRGVTHVPMLTTGIFICLIVFNFNVF